MNNQKAGGIPVLKGFCSFGAGEEAIGHSHVIRVFER
jgi:hypothetical protein